MEPGIFIPRSRGSHFFHSGEQADSQIKSMHIQGYTQLPNINMTKKFLHRDIGRHGDDRGNFVMAIEVWKQRGCPLLEEKIMKHVVCTQQSTLENWIAPFMFSH